MLVYFFVFSEFGGTDSTIKIIYFPAKFKSFLILEHGLKSWQRNTAKWRLFGIRKAYNIRFIQKGS